MKFHKILPPSLDDKIPIDLTISRKTMKEFRRELELKYGKHMVTQEILNREIVRATERDTELREQWPLDQEQLK